MIEREQSSAARRVRLLRAVQLGEGFGVRQRDEELELPVALAGALVTAGQAVYVEAEVSQDREPTPPPRRRERATVPEAPEHAAEVE